MKPENIKVTPLSDFPIFLVLMNLFLSRKPKIYHEQIKQALYMIKILKEEKHTMAIIA